MLNEFYKYSPVKKKKNTELIESKIYEIDNLFKKFLSRGQKLYDIEIEDLSRDEFANLIFYIISKDKLYLKLYNNLVKYFLNRYTKYGKFDGDKEYLLKKLSISMHAEKYHRDHIIFRIDDLGDKFYLILKGSVSIVIVQENYTYLTPQEYNLYLDRLKFYKEYDLLKLVFSYSNKIKVNHNLLKSINQELSLAQLSKINLSLKQKIYKINDNYVSSIDFVERIQPKIDYSSEESRVKVQIATYKIVATLNEGDTFGEVALSKTEKEERKRTATVITESECLFGTILNNVYRSFLKEVEEKNRLILINQALQHTLFNDVDPENFIKYNYLNFFNIIKYKSGEVLFQQGEIRNAIYFINDGHVDLYTESSFEDISNYINNLKKSLNKDKEQLNKNKNNIYQIDEDYIIDKEYLVQKQINPAFRKYYTTKRLIKIYNITKKDTLGYDEYVYINDKFFLSAKVISETCQVFVLQINLLPTLLKDRLIKKNYDIIKLERKEIMIERLRKMKNIFLDKNLENNKVILSIADATKIKKKRKRGLNVLKYSRRKLDPKEKDNRNRIKKDIKHVGFSEKKILSLKTKRRLSVKNNIFHSAFFKNFKNIDINENSPIEKKLKNKNYCIQSEEEMEKYKDRINKSRSKTVNFKNIIRNNDKNEDENIEEKEKVILPILFKKKLDYKTKNDTFFRTENKIKDTKRYDGLISRMTDLSKKLMINEYGNKMNKNKINNYNNMTQFDFLFYDYFFTERSNKNYSKNPLITE